MTKVNISKLGREFKETKSEKIFKQIFETCKEGVINYYRNFDNSIEKLEDCYIETMISIWNDIDKIDVHNYSISTMIYLKMKQNIIATIRKKNDSNFLDINETVIMNGLQNKESIMVDSLEEQIIQSEDKDNLWGTIKRELNNEMSFNMVYDKYVNNMKCKDIANKHEVTQQIVLNRLFHARKKLEKNKSIINEYNK